VLRNACIGHCTSVATSVLRIALARPQHFQPLSQLHCTRCIPTRSGRRERQELNSRNSQCRRPTCEERREARRGLGTYIGNSLDTQRLPPSLGVRLTLESTSATKTAQFYSAHQSLTQLLVFKFASRVARSKDCGDGIDEGCQSIDQRGNTICQRQIFLTRQSCSSSAL
jgi:hypothetical protein